METRLELDEHEEYVTTLQCGHLLCHSQAKHGQTGVGLEMERTYYDGKDIQDSKDLLSV